MLSSAPMRRARVLSVLSAVALLHCATGSTETDVVSGAGGAPPTSAATGSGGGQGGASAGGHGGELSTSSAGGATSSGVGGGSPCENVACDSPPPNTCEGSSDLLVYEAHGTCDAGDCYYPSAAQVCAGGCASGACIDNPCAGVSCNTPPTKICSDANHLRVYDAPGTCSEGTCSYASHEEFCSFGCQGDICNGDPCAGVTCSSPPANYCKDASTLVVRSPTGLCASGVCSYPNSTELSCAFGCVNGACKNDPCAGKTCASPPANDCKDATTARVYASTGTCSGGLCSYAATELSCPHGCVGGVCRDCDVDADCGSGKWCQSNTCTPCSTDAHCGATCTSCTATGDVCSAGSCVDCVVDSQCGSGKYCASSSCVGCTTNAKCGPSCVTCGANQQCDGTSCAVCKTDAACGATCAPCGGTTPYCVDLGATSVCAGCRSDTDCSGSDVCDTSSRTCGPACSPTGVTVFSDDFSTPNSLTWYEGTDVAVGTSRWKTYTSTSKRFATRISSGRLAITNSWQQYPDHGQGYAYVRAGGAGAAYDTSAYASTLKDNAGQVVWTFNMHRDDFATTTTDGGFKCSSTSSQNYVTFGYGYILGATSAAGLNASTGTCSPSATANGYAVVMGGDGSKIRLVRFANGLRNGAITDILKSASNSNETYYYSVRVTYTAATNQWTLETRNDGSSGFKDPASGTFTSAGSAVVDSTYTSTALDFTGPYYQGGCAGLCDDTVDVAFDNVKVVTRCAP